MKYAKSGAGVALAVALAGCATDDPHRRAKTGAAIGAVLGGVIGHQADSDQGRYIGAAVGAIAGAAVGDYMDKQYAEMQKRLAEEARRKELQVTQLPDKSLRVGITADASFDVNSAQMRPEALNTYAKIAQVLKDYDRTVVHVVGHTDSTGADDYNQGLSVRRAASVATYLQNQGVPGTRVRQEGRGESEPVAGNDSADGRKRNRRVDIVIKPVVEGREQDAWTPPPGLGA
ncbi:MAG: OmpA family protein [Gammaproteobacteria bacterium]|nr:OmpA family protein [Gammaproteobacteria bacterium]